MFQNGIAAFLECLFLLYFSWPLLSQFSYNPFHDTGLFLYPLKLHVKVKWTVYNRTTCAWHASQFWNFETHSTNLYVMFMYSMFMSWKTVLPFVSKNFYLQHLLWLTRFYIGVCFCVCWYLVFIKWKWKLKSKKYSHSKRKFERNILREKIRFLNWHVDDKYVKKTIPHDYCIKCFGFQFTSCEGFYLKFMLFTSKHAIVDICQ